MIKKFLFYLTYFLSPLLIIITIFFSNVTLYSQINHLIPLILGAAAYTWLCAEFILIARTKYIEKICGLDKFYRFHALMAVISIVLAFIHKIIEEEVSRNHNAGEMGDAAWAIFLVISGLSLIFMADILVSKIKLLKQLRNLLEKLKLTKYQYVVAVHNATVIALILMFIHVMLTTAAKESITARLVYIVYFVIGLSFYLYHRIFKVFILRKKMFTVSEVICESKNMYTLRLTPDNGRVFNYKPGQFCFLRIFQKNFSIEEHPFSITSDPSNRDYISVTIKNLGDYTSIISEIAVGSKVFVDGPYGRFSYTNFPKEKELILIAGGVGITPMLSMLRHIRNTDKNKKVMLLWGINNASDLICKDELDTMQNELQNFLLIPIASKDDTWAGEKGFIDAGKIKNILKKYDKDTGLCSFYICGPVLMLNKVLKGLKLLGIKRKSIHFERFSI